MDLPEHGTQREGRVPATSVREDNWLTVIAINVNHALIHVNAQGISVLYPILREQFGFGYTGIALLSVVAQLAEGPFQLSFGVLTRFIRRARIIAVGAVVSFIGVAGMALSQNYSHLLASRVIRGLGSSPNHPVGGALMSDRFPRARSRALGLFQTSGNIGGWMAPLLMGGLLHVMGWRPAVLILGFPLLLTSLVLFLVREAAPNPEDGTGGSRRVRLGLSEYKAVLRDRNAMLVALVMMVGAAGRGTGALSTYLPTFLVDRYGISASFSALFFAAYMMGGVIGPLVLGGIADRTSPRSVLGVSLILSAFSALLLLTPRSPGIILGMVTFLAGSFIFSRGSLTQSMLIHLGPKGIRVDTLLSFYHTAGELTGPGWNLITGFIADRFGISTALLVMAISYCSGMVILTFVKPKSDGN